MSILYILLFFILFVIFLGLGIIGSILRFLFGNKQKPASSGQKNSSGQEKQSVKWYTYNKKKKKIFKPDEGEYVEFEEIKDQDKEK